MGSPIHNPSRPLATEKLAITPTHCCQCCHQSLPWPLSLSRTPLNQNATTMYSTINVLQPSNTAGQRPSPADCHSKWQCQTSRQPSSPPTNLQVNLLQVNLLLNLLVPKPQQNQHQQLKFNVQQGKDDHQPAHQQQNQSCQLIFFKINLLQLQFPAQCPAPWPNQSFQQGRDVVDKELLVFKTLVTQKFQLGLDRCET